MVFIFIVFTSYYPYIPPVELVSFQLNAFRGGRPGYTTRF